MITKVGMQNDFLTALKDLTELDYDAVEAYEAAIDRLEAVEYKLKLIEFRKDHEKHIQDLTALLISHGETAPAGPSIGKQWLAKGKVILAELIGDKAILSAMASNEEDTNIAYERMNLHNNKWEDATDILKRGWEDEKRHKKWLESVIKNA